MGIEFTKLKYCFKKNPLNEKEGERIFEDVYLKKFLCESIQGFVKRPRSLQNAGYTPKILMAKTNESGLGQSSKCNTQYLHLPCVHSCFLPIHYEDNQAKRPLLPYS